MKFSTLSALCTAGLLLALPARAAPATYLLIIDIADPSAVTFTATIENPLQDVSLAINFTGGITLENFFASNQSILTGLAITGALTPEGTTTSYNELVTFNYDANTGTVEAGDDLSVYNVDVPNSDTQDFVTGASAFTGAGTVNFTGYTLPTVGAIGSINIGYRASDGGLLGHWTVVNTAIPEPSTYALLIGVVAFGVVAHRRRGQRS